MDVPPPSSSDGLMTAIDELLVELKPEGERYGRIVSLTAAGPQFAPFLTAL
jgi:hypothetical protein